MIEYRSSFHESTQYIDVIDQPPADDNLDAAHLAYWRQQLRDIPVLEWPGATSRPAAGAATRSSQALAPLPEVIEPLAALGSQEDASLFMIALAALKVLLYRYSGQTDLAVAAPEQGAAVETPRFWILRTDLAGNPTFRDLLRRVRQTALAAFARPGLPLDRSGAGQSQDSAQPVQVLFVASESGARPGAGAAGFDLALALDVTAAGLSATIDYAADLFAPATIDRLGGHFLTLLQGLAAHPDTPIDRVPLLPEAERRQLLLDWNATATAYPREATLPALFAEQAARTPDAIAIVSGDEALSYHELDQRANQLAHALRRHGLGPDTLVPLCAERSLEMIVGILGILKAGGAYVPVDTAFPTERLAWLLADTRATVVLGQARMTERLPAHGATLLHLDTDWPTIAQEPVSALPLGQLSPDNLVYVMYTSGSTGMPKGVAVTHRNVTRLVRETHYAGFGPGQVLLQLAPVAFDAATFELWGALLHGARLALAPAQFPALAELGRLLQQQQVSMLWLTAGLFHQLVEIAPHALRGVRQLLTGGDVVSAAHVQQLHETLPDVQVIDGYGPTECTTFTTTFALDAATPLDRSIPIGRPIANASTYILDQHLAPVPVGVVGELYIGGDGLARGYLNRPELTAERFIPNPFERLEIRDWRLGDADSPISNLQSLISMGTRLYKTGDLARYLPDGNIEFLGRIDNQVKLRGFRIELGEIESVLRRHPTVDNAAVLVHEYVPGDKRLVAYIVQEPRTKNQEPNGVDSGSQFSVLGSGELRAFLKDRLPGYMVPSAFVTLTALPLTPNGKLDRRALPAPEVRDFGIDLEAADSAPQTPVERRLAAIWAEVLGLAAVDRQAHFFEQGGHSLLATQLLARIREAFGVELPMRALFEAPVLARLAERVAASGAMPAPAAAIGSADRKAPLPLSSDQQRLWFLDQWEQGNPAYIIPLAFSLTGQLDIAALEQSLNALIQRHEALRTTFPTVDGRPSQLVAPVEALHDAALPLPVVDLRATPAAEREAEASRLTLELGRAPFDLARGPLMHMKLLKLDDEEHLLLGAVHHIVFDGWSEAIFSRDLAAFYTSFTTGAPAELPTLPIQFADYAAWQRQRLQGENLAVQLDYWGRQLGGAPPLLELPADRSRQAELSYRGATYPVALPTSLIDTLARLGRRESATLFMTLLAAFQVVLARYTGQTDIVVGSPIAGRARAELEQMIGFFVNTLALRTGLGGNPSFRELLRRVREVCLGAYAHQDVPFDQLVERLQPARNPSHHPIFQVMFSLNATDFQAIALPNMTMRQLPIDNQTAKFDLTLMLQPTDRGLIAAWEYNTALFDESTIARMAGSFMTVLEAIVAAPERGIEELPLLGADERRRLLIERNATAAEIPPLCAHHLFEQQAARTPNTVAATFEGTALTYRELNERANRVANYLGTLGVGPEALVGLSLSRSLDLIVAVLGVLKAGAAYLPLDPSLPSERLGFMIEDARPAVLLTATTDDPFAAAQGRRRPTTDGDRLDDAHPLTRSPAHPLTGVVGGRWSVVDLVADWPTIAQQPDTNPDSAVRPENLAYMIYTSGSTGKPKGVQIPHHALVNFLCTMARRPGLSADDTLLAITTLSFDIAGLELLLPLTVGARLAIASQEAVADGALLAQTIAGTGATVMQATPAGWRLLIESGWQGADLKILCGGEALSSALAEQLRTRGKALWNMYGPTETTIWSAVQLIDAQAGRIPIGAPIANTQLYVLDAQLQPAPIGVVGELYIGGDGLARGYLNRPDLTAERFIPNPFAPTTDDRRPTTDDREPRTENQPPWLENRESKIENGSIDASEMRSSIFHPPSSDGVGGQWSAIGGRLYRTGDLARSMPDGSIEFLGRIDHQVKVRGFRIELGEIETALRRHPAVREAVVLAREDTPGDVRLVAYLAQEPRTKNQEPSIQEQRTENKEQNGEEPRTKPALPFDPSTSLRAGGLRNRGGEGNQEATGPDTGSRSSVLGSGQGSQSGTLWVVLGSEELRALLKRTLPDYMVPAVFVMLEAFPLTPSGKIDRRALPRPDSTRREVDQPFVAPRNPNEERLAAIWSKLLGARQIGIHDNFFRLGGHSLLLTQLASELRAAFRVELPLRVLFDAPTIAGMSKAIVAKQLEQVKATDAARMLAKLKQLSANEIKAMLAEQRGT